MDFWTAATNFGVALVCLAVLGWAVWRALVWGGINIAQPMAQRHIKFLDDLSTAMASQSQALQTMAVQQGRNMEGMQKILEATAQVMGQMESVLETQRAVLQAIRGSSK